jgi:hypothetical protein
MDIQRNARPHRGHTVRMEHIVQLDYLFDCSFEDATLRGCYVFAH